MKGASCRRLPHPRLRRLPALLLVLGAALSCAPAPPADAPPDPAPPHPAHPDPTSPDPTSPDPTSPDPTSPDPAHLDPTHPDRILGLILLPQVFGAGPCDPFTPAPIPLFAEPDATAEPRGSIEVTVPWTLHDVGGCEGLTVEGRRSGSPLPGARLPGTQRSGAPLPGTPQSGTPQSGASASRPLPTLEAGYEEPAGIVLEHRGPWVRIRLEEGSAWMQAGPDNIFLPLEHLLERGLTYLANPPGALAPGTPVEVLETRWVEAELWVRVAILSHSPCDSLQDPVPTSEEWLPAHAADGEPTVWFYSRGC